MYPGPALPVDQVAILVISQKEGGLEKNGLGNGLELDTVDGLHPEWGYGHLYDNVALELPPGFHRLEFYYSSHSLHGTYGQSIELVFEPGMLYHASALATGVSWKSAVKRDGLIPEGFTRPTKSCESLPNGSKSPQKCLQPGDAAKVEGLVVVRDSTLRQQESSVTGATTITVEYSATGATFSIEGMSSREIHAGRLILDQTTKDLDLKKESDKAEFLARYAKLRKFFHPNLDDLVIKCQQFQMP